MFTSPALIPCVSVWGIGMSRDAIPSTTKTRPANSTIFINGSGESCRIQRALLWERCLTGSLFWPHFVESAVIRRVLEALPFPAMVPGVFQFSQSFSDPPTRQDKPHPHFLHIQFPERNYVGVRPLFAL